MKPHIFAEFLHDLADNPDKADQQWLARWKHITDARWYSPSDYNNAIIAGDLDLEMMRKPDTVTFNGQELPRPLRDVKPGDSVWLEAASGFYAPTFEVWPSKPSDALGGFVPRGRVHATKEAAEQWARARYPDLFTTN